MEGPATLTAYNGTLGGPGEDRGEILLLMYY